MTNYEKYLKSIKKNNAMILLSRITIVISFILLWEILSRYGIINSFIFSKPSSIVKMFFVYLNNNLLYSIYITSSEIIITFILSIIISLLGAVILYSNKTFYKVIEPFIIAVNSLPKVAIGPLLIIIVGTNIKTIITMGLLISVLPATIQIVSIFNNTDESLLMYFKSIKASKLETFYYAVFRSNLRELISVLKLNISMVLIGVIMGELLCSKAGIGYLISYGSSIFNLDLVMMGIILLLIISTIFYYIVAKIEDIYIRRTS